MGGRRRRGLLGRRRRSWRRANAEAVLAGAYREDLRRHFGTPEPAGFWSRYLLGRADLEALVADAGRINTDDRPAVEFDAPRDLYQPGEDNAARLLEERFREASSRRRFSGPRRRGPRRGGPRGDVRRARPPGPRPGRRAARLRGRSARDVRPPGGALRVQDGALADAEADLGRAVAAGADARGRGRRRTAPGGARARGGSRGRVCARGHRGRSRPRAPDAALDLRRRGGRARTGGRLLAARSRGAPRPGRRPGPRRTSPGQRGRRRSRRARSARSSGGSGATRGTADPPAEAAGRAPPDGGTAGRGARPSPRPEPFRSRHRPHGHARPGARVLGRHAEAERAERVRARWRVASAALIRRRRVREYPPV